MISFVGSSYQYTGEQLAHPEIIFVQDHHYNEELQEFPIKHLLDNSLCNPKEHKVIFDHVLQHDDVLSDYNLVFLPLLLARYSQQFIDHKITPNWNHKTRSFNFMINKPRIHRIFLLMLIEHFGLTDYEYTLCWKHTRCNIKQSIIEPREITIPPRQYLFGTENLLDQGLQYGRITNPEVYKNFLQQHVFEPSCVSLITEPVFYERETIVTEKTMMAIYGGTVPIWVGGWRIPDYMRSKGFDIFDDIVDHSYQNLSDPYERCYQAVHRNLHLLQNRCQVDHTRLQKNLDLLEQNQFWSECQTITDQLPKELQVKLL